MRFPARTASTGCFRATYWSSPARTPPFYPDAVTLLAEVTVAASTLRRRTRRGLLGEGQLCVPGPWRCRISTSVPSRVVGQGAAGGGPSSSPSWMVGGDDGAQLREWEAPGVTFPADRASSGSRFCRARDDCRACRLRRRPHRRGRVRQPKFHCDRAQQRLPHRRRSRLRMGGRRQFRRSAMGR